MSIDIAMEFTAATAAVKTHHFDALVAADVSRQFLFASAMKFGVSRIETDVTTYEPAATGTPAIIMPARPLGAPWEDFDDDVLDLIAWRLSEPSKWWTRCGIATVMNPDAIDRAEIYKQSLELHATPLAWLQAKGAGAVILDDTANLSLLLGSVRQVVSDDLAYIQRIKRRMQLQERRLPEFRVITEVQGVAAE